MSRPFTTPPPWYPKGDSSPPPDTQAPPDYDEEQERRHREFMRRWREEEDEERERPLPRSPVSVFPAPPPPQGPSQPGGTYERMRQDLAETRKRIAALEKERARSRLPDWLWDWLFGQELRLLKGYAKGLEWQLEIFDRANQEGKDPVAAVNQWRRERAEMFINAVQDHLEIMGMAIGGIEGVRAFAKQMEEILQGLDASRRRAAFKWALDRAKQRASTPGEGTPRPQRPRSVGRQGGRPGGLTPREWERIRARKQAGEMRGPEGDEADRRYGREYSPPPGSEARYGQTVGKMSRSADGKTLTITTYQLSPEGKLSPPTTVTIPIEEAPVDMGLAPGQSTPPFVYTNAGPGGG